MSEELVEQGAGKGLEPPSERALRARDAIFGEDFTTVEAAFILGFDDPGTVLRYRSEGKLPGYRLGREYRFTRQSLERFREQLLREEEENSRRIQVEREAERKLKRAEALAQDSVRVVPCRECGTRIALEHPSEAHIVLEDATRDSDSFFAGQEMSGLSSSPRQAWIGRCPFCDSYPEIYQESKAEVNARVAAEFDRRTVNDTEGLIEVVPCVHCGTDAIAREMNPSELSSGFEWPAELRADCEFCNRDSYIGTDRLLSAHEKTNYAQTRQGEKRDTFAEVVNAD